MGDLEFEWLRRRDKEETWAEFLRPLDEISGCGVETGARVFTTGGFMAAHPPLETAPGLQGALAFHERWNHASTQVPCR